MPVLTQSIGGNAIDHIIATFQTDGQSLIDPTSTSFLFGQYQEGASPNTYNYTTNHILARGTNITYDGFGPATGTLTSIELHGPHIAGTPNSGDHEFSSLLEITGAAFDVSSFRWAVLLGDFASLQAQLAQQQWTFNGSADGDEFTGGVFADDIYGKGGSDTLGGGDGADNLWGGLGADQHVGGDGPGIDYARYDDANYGNLVIRLTGIGNTGAAAGDTYSGIEGIVGGVGNDSIAGNGARNYLYGGGGTDNVRGGGGNDYLNGGAAGDSLYGGLGADQHVGGDGAGIDYARYDDANYGNLVISLVSPSGNTGAAAGDTYEGIEGVYGGVGNDKITGNSARNYLYGGDGNDSVRGGGGNDYLAGGTGADHLFGGLGADQHVGGDGIDYARYDDANHGNLVINLSTPGLNTGAAAGDTYVSIEGVFGGAGNDTITGDSVRNFLNGGAGSDILDGKGGNDILTGGAGARDDYRFTTALGTGNVDSIVGFEHGVDKIVLSRAIFADIGAALASNEFGSAPDANNFLIYNQSTGQLSYDDGGSGGAPGPIVFATFAAGTTLDVSDFLLIA